MDDNTTILEAIDWFLTSHTANTARAYRAALNHFVTFLQGRGIDAQSRPADDLTVDHAVHFVPHLRQQEFKKNTMELYLTATYRFYRHLLKTGHQVSPVDLARLEETYKDARQIRGEERPLHHTLSAVQAVIQAARAVEVQPGPWQDQRRLVRLRDIAIVETLRATGCRVGELVGLKLSDLGPNEQSALVKGKGSKYRQVYFDSLAWNALKTYLRERGLEAGQDVPLFVGHGNRSDGAALTERHVSRTILRLGRAAGVEDVTPHYFRHVFGTRALEKTNNLALVQDMLGHASPTTTRVYAKTDEKQAKAAHEQVWA